MFLESPFEFVPNAETNGGLLVCASPEVGLGVVTLQPAKAGEILDRFTGEIGPDITQHSLQVAPGLHISQTRFIGYLSHGCEPNCRLDMQRFELIALRDLAAGELLTIDYAATEDVLHIQFACHCGADQCRRWITGNRDPANVEGIGYLAALPRYAQEA